MPLFQNYSARKPIAQFCSPLALQLTPATRRCFEAERLGPLPCDRDSNAATAKNVFGDQQLVQQICSRAKQLRSRCYSYTHTHVQPRTPLLLESHSSWFLTHTNTHFASHAHSILRSRTSGFRDTHIRFQSHDSTQNRFL